MRVEVSDKDKQRSRFSLALPAVLSKWSLYHKIYSNWNSKGCEFDLVWKIIVRRFQNSQNIEDATFVMLWLNLSIV